MPGSHWMIITSPENFEITRQRGLNVLGLKARHRKKAERMASGDRVLYYISRHQAFPATATTTSGFFEDHRVIWKNAERRPEVFPWRVHIRPDMVLEEHEYLDARQIAPRLLYVKRWPPEDWPLVFQGQLHLLSAADFSLIEHEMRRLIERRGQTRERPPRRPRERPDAQVVGAAAGA
ncbi:MAG TPA: EVE domain-containing protein [Chloroflexota bacterium]|nr:EVE domain-containing protein [Chloroflexota bacterium]